MAATAFSLLRNFSATKFYEAAGLTSAVPFTAGVLLVPQGIGLKRSGAAMTAQYLFGNAAEAGVAGMSFRQLAAAGAPGQFSAQQGTVDQNSGPVDSAQAVMADATADASSQALANGFKSEQLGSLPVTTGTVRQFATPKPNKALLAIMVVDGTNQLLYINGQLVASTARNATASVLPFRLGLAPDAANMPADNCLFGGCFYHAAAINDGQVADLMAAAVTQKDVPVGTLNLGGNLTLDYVWSTKIGNPDARATWASRGGALTPLNMLRNGTWTAADVLSADYTWL